MDVILNGLFLFRADFEDVLCQNEAIIHKTYLKKKIGRGNWSPAEIRPSRDLNKIRAKIGHQKDFM